MFVPIPSKHYSFHQKEDDGAHGKADLIMYPDEDWQDGRPARNTIIVRTGGGTQKKRRTLLKTMNKKTSIPLVKTEVELLLEQPHM